MRFMIVSFAILFGILSLAPNMQGGQYFKVNEIVEHYKVHQQSNESFRSFISFVKDHYFQNHNHHDNERQMPFKSMAVAPVFLTVQDFQLKPVSEFHFLAGSHKNFFGEPGSKVQGCFEFIWNPPKMLI